MFAEANFRAICMDETYINRLGELHILQLGTFVGHASEWIAKHLLSHPESTLTDVDTWEGSEENAHGRLDFSRIHAEYLERIEKFKKVNWYKTTTADFFREETPEAYYDLIYIDADHTAIGVLDDAVKSHPLLKVGGLLVFDDYTWVADDASPYNSPKLAIDAFMKVYANKYETVLVNAQVWLRRIA
jgi:predicted O-methyltransferase YrrM